MHLPPFPSVDILPFFSNHYLLLDAFSQLTSAVQPFPLALCFPPPLHSCCLLSLCGRYWTKYCRLLDLIFKRALQSRCHGSQVPRWWDWSLDAHSAQVTQFWWGHEASNQAAQAQHLQPIIKVFCPHTHHSHLSCLPHPPDPRLLPEGRVYVSFTSHSTLPTPHLPASVAQWAYTLSQYSLDLIEFYGYRI